MNVSMESEFSDPELGRSKGASGSSQQMDFSRDSDRIGESDVKAELCSPGPATPMQVAPLPQQKPREASTSCPYSATTRSTHSFEAAKTSCELQLASGTPTSLPACTQGGVQSETENGQPLIGSDECSVGASQTLETTSPVSVAVKRGVGHPSGSGDLATMGGHTKAFLKDEVQVRVASKSSEEEVSMSSCGTIERACSDRSMTSMGRLSSSMKAESAGFALDAGLSLGSNAVQFSERACVEFSRVWENAGGSGGRSGDSYVGSSREEGAVVLHLSQGRGGNGEGEKGEMGMGGEWQGKHLELSFGLEAEEKVEGGRVDGKVEPYLRQVVEENAGVGLEDVAKDCRDSSDDRLTKRVKREAMERRSVEESREQIWERNEDQDGSRNGLHENKEEDFKSLFWCNGGAPRLPQSYRERALGKVVELGSGEPKTVVVKKTPKRVHNSDPSAMFSRSELMMFEDSMRSPGSVPRVMFTPSNKQGVNGSMFTSDLANFANQHCPRKSANLACGRERGVEYNKSFQNNNSVHQSELESRLDRGSSCSLMSTPKNALLMCEPSLPLSLNFSPKPQRPVVSRTSTEEEWGKSLALCGPGAESPGEVERSGEEAKALSCQERFIQLQVFLKKCDEDDQSNLLDGLRSLSAAGRSSHAVVLEQRALWLSIEEGKEMTRLKSLNVMGQRSSMKGQSEVGCTGEGRGVASLGSGAECAQQQLFANMRCPQMQMKMPVSGPMPVSGYKESYRSG